MYYLQGREHLKQHFDLEFLFETACKGRYTEGFFIIEEFEEKRPVY
jgi:hypothetical protein